ncbi:MAG: APC family permease, partial [Nitrososphaerales archaeon]
FASGMVFALVFTTTQFAWFYGNTGGANLPLSLLIAAVPFAVLMIAYWAIGLAMPRSGSDYVWVSRIFSPSIGFAWSLLYMFVIFFVAYVGEISPFSFAFSSSLTVSGIVTNSPSLANMGTFLGGPQGTFLLASLFTIVFGIFAIFGSRFAKGVIYVSWIAAIIGMFLMWYILSSANPTVFAANWDKMLANNPASGLNSSASYSNVYNAALKGGAPTPTGNLFGGAILALPLASLFLFGGNYINAFAGEIKNVKKAIPIALFLSLLFGVIYWTITSTLTLNAVGSNWMTAVGWGWDSGGTSSAAYPLPFAPSQPLILGVIAYPNSALISVMFFTYLLGSIAPLFAYFWIPSKYFFAWSFDRAIPSRFSNISQRFNTPYLSIIAIVVLGIVLSYFYEFTGFSTSFTIGSVIWGVSYIIPGLALMVFPFVKKDIFQKSPGFVKSKIGGLPLMTIVGFVVAISFAYIGYIGYLNPAVTSTATAPYGFALVASVIIIGFVIYFASKLFYKGKGIDVSLAFKEIPPE